MLSQVGLTLRDRSRILMPSIFADVIWPALLLEGRMLTWWAIAVGLVIEYFFVRKVTHLSFGRTIWADLAMNGVSALFGVLLIPIAGLVWEFFPGLLIYKLFNIGTFNPGTWSATLFMAVVINTLIERAALRRFFKQPVDGRGAFWLLFLGNFLSVGLAFASLFVFLPKRG
jgi:hypothetical protein